MTFIQMNRLQQKKEGLRRAVGNKAGGGITIAACVLILAITAVGCGKVEDPVPVRLSAGDMEELEDGADGTDAAGAEARPDADKNAEGGLAHQEDTGAGNTESEAAKKTAKKAEQAGADNSSVDTQSVESTQLEGDVRSVEMDGFVICKHETWEEDGYSYAVAVAPGYEEESALITIHTAQNCVYQYKTVKNSGINPEDVSTRDGSFKDVKEGLSATIQGSWQDDGSFLADRIVLMEIV